MKGRLKLFVLIGFMFLNLLVAQPTPKTERLALLELRGSLGIRAIDWRRKVNPCSNWKGIKCTNGTVTEITLSGLRRTRRGKQNPQFAVDSLSKFSMLTSFNSSGFLLKGAIPEWLGQRLRNLEVLDLSSSSITGSIPSELGSLSRLKVLNLGNNSLSATIPAQLGKLSHLITLDLGFNSFFGPLPEELRGLTSLRNMVVTNNVLEGPLLDGLFQKLTELKYLNVSGNHFYGNLSSWIGKVDHVDLSDNYFEGSLPSGTAGRIILSNNCFLGPGQRTQEVCMSFYANRSLSFGNGGGREAFAPPMESRSSRKRFVYIMIGVFGGLGFMVVLISGTMLLLRVCKSGGTDNRRNR